MIRAKNGLVLVVFAKSWGSYQSGATAGFPDKEAKRLVGMGVAKYKGTPAAVPPAPEQPVTAAPVRRDETDDDGDPLGTLSEDWRDWHWNTLKAIAKRFTDAPIENKADAIAAIELALEARDADDHAEGDEPTGADENGQ